MSEIFVNKFKDTNKNQYSVVKKSDTKFWSTLIDSPAFPIRRIIHHSKADVSRIQMSYCSYAEVAIKA